MVQTYPQDEKNIRRNALNIYSKEKISEGSVASVAFSLTSWNETMEDGSDDSVSSGGKSTASRGTQKTAASGQSSSSRKSAKSTTSKDSKIASKKNEGDAGRSRSKAKKSKASTKTPMDKWQQWLMECYQMMTQLGQTMRVQEQLIVHSFMMKKIGSWSDSQH